MPSFESTAPGPAQQIAPTALAAAVRRLRQVRPALAVILDFDGTLAPIVNDPAAVQAEPGARAAIEALAGQLPLVACVTGRPALAARGFVGVAGIAYTGLHGAEVLAPGAEQPVTPPAFVADGRAVHAIVEAARAEPQGLSGLMVEEKGPIVALHWRTATDAPRAAARARELGARAVQQGLRSGEGRSVLELRPALELTKGDGVRALLAAAPTARHALFAGDDLTDLDAFAALRALVREQQLESVTLVAVAGADAPPQVAAAADLVVADPAALCVLLAALAAPGDGAADAGSPPQTPTGALPLDCQAG